MANKSKLLIGGGLAALLAGSYFLKTKQGQKYQKKIKTLIQNNEVPKEEIMMLMANLKKDWDSVSSLIMSATKPSPKRKPAAKRAKRA